MGRFDRTRALLGDKVDLLATKRVVVFGVGGVGSYVIEALARSGVGSITIVDNDCVAESNINRQIIALTSTIGRNKVDVARERIMDINPDCKVIAKCEFITPENASSYFDGIDYAIDAIDNVSAKIALCIAAKEKGVPLISCMGTGNKLDPSKLQIADLSKTHTCPLAKVMRLELKRRGIAHQKVLFSTEQAIRPTCSNDDERIIGSVAFVPSVAGLMIAGEVIKDLII